MPVWIGLDAYDNSPSVFYKLLATGVYSLQPDNENMGRILTDSAFSATPVEHMVELMSEMHPTTQQYVFVLDDFHTITNGEIIKSLPLILRRLPHTFVSFILSRGEVPAELLPLMKNGKRDEICIYGNRRLGHRCQCDRTDGTDCGKRRRCLHPFL